MSRTTSPVRVPDATDADHYRVNVTESLPDAPPFSDEVRQYAHYKPFPGENWTAFKSRIDMSHANAAAANDPARPVWDPQKFQSIQTEDSGEQQLMDNALDHAFTAARQFADVGWESEVAHRVLRKLADLAGACGLLPHTTDPNTTEFAWSPVRCVFAAGGPKLHKDLCTRFSNEPGFPWVEETPAEWDASIRQAHAAQGWPTTVAVVRWSAFSRLPEPAEDKALPSWMYWRAWVHVLTTLRYDPLDRQLRMVHDGRCVIMTLENTSNLLIHQKRAVPVILTGLGCTSDVQKKAVLYVLARLTLGHLLTAATCGELPFTVIASKWSRLQPDRSVEGWSECKMRVTNAWIAGSGVISPDLTDEEAVLEYAWADAQLDETARHDLAVFVAGVPQSYTPTWPSALLHQSFPNITDCGISDTAARDVLLDTFLVADMMRGECPAFYKEYPIFCALPEIPTLNDSVNQGKTTLCLHYARASVPGLTVLKFHDTSSAPDQRAVADELRRMGTLCLDEFSIPRSSLSILSRGNMASLATGGDIPVGQVLKNTNEKVGLKHPLYLSTKGMDMTEDLLTRAFCVFLRDLTETERDAEGVWETLKTARLSILLRLSALDLIQKHRLVEQMKSRKHSSAGWRFGAHRSLAILLYQIRTGASPERAELAIKRAIAENKVRVTDHSRMADDQGVLTSLRESRDMRITLEQVFTEVTAGEAKIMADFIAAKHQMPRMTPRVNMKGLMQARMAVDGRQEQPLGVGFNQLTNLGVGIGERTVSSLLANEIKRRIPEEAAWRLPGIAGAMGWFLYRHRGRKGDGLVQVSMVHVPEHAEHALLHGNIDDVPE